jgi:glucose-1-phosphate cytidylyltransferase
MKVVLLTGGLGTRLAELTDVIPKPMVDIGGRPLLWHIMKTYSFYGFNEFVVALGYKGEVIKDYFLRYYHRHSDVTLRLRDGSVDVHGGDREDWIVHLVDTGLPSGTGGRIRRLVPRLGNEPTMVTYGDGVANIDVNELVEFHRRHGKLATLTAVRPPARFGTFTSDGDRVTAFVEKPQLGEGWINGGFFILEPGVLDYIEGDETMFEQEPLSRLAQDGQLMAFRHHGFWQGTDTLRDVRLLRRLWEEGNATWRVWDH